MNNKNNLIISRILQFSTLYFRLKDSAFFIGKFRDLLELPTPVIKYKSMKAQKKDAIEAGYKYVCDNKDNLEALSRRTLGIVYVDNVNPNWLKGMLNALKDLGLVK